METLRHSDILALNTAIGEIYAARNLETFYQSVFSSIRAIIPYELCSCADASIHPARFLKLTTSSQEHDDVSSKLLPAFNAHLHGHPLIPHCFSGNVVKTTDYLSTSQFKSTDIHNEYYRHLDVETQICFSIPVSRQKVSLFALSRKLSDFSETDRLLLTLLKPHLLNALRNVMELDSIRLERALLRKGAEAQRQGVVLCQQNGMIIAISEIAWEMFGRYFAVTLAEGDLLPGALARWLETETEFAPPTVENTGTSRSLGRLTSQVERDAFIVVKDSKRLIIKLMNDVTNGEYILSITEYDPGVLLRNLQRYGLSPRETEVLRWLSKGKTNVEIAVILSMSKRTADKHLEHIFAKLGVETRAAAVAITRNVN